MMMSDSKRIMLQTKGVVLGRVLMGLLFLFSGLGMLFMQGPANVAGYFESIGLPLAGILVWAVIALKIVAGGALVIGMRVGAAAAALAVFTLLTIPIAHGSIEDVNLFKNLAIVGGLIYVMAFGAGHWTSPKSPVTESVDI